MKSLLVLLSVLASGQMALASKARVTALQGAAHIQDLQTSFSNPNHIRSLPNLMSLEFGPSAAAAGAPKAEGGLLMTAENKTRYGIYLGHMSEPQNSLRATAGGYPAQSNPIDFFYANETLAFNVNFSNSKNGTNDSEEQFLGGTVGFYVDDISMTVGLDLLGKSKKAANDELKTNPSVSFGANRTVGHLYYHGGLAIGSVQTEIGTATSKLETTGLEIGVINRQLAAPGRDLFYGIGLQYGEMKAGNAKSTNMSLPAILGLEYSLASWAVVRGSLTQNILISSAKNGAAAPPADKAVENANNTVAAAGFGFTHNDVTLDVTAEAAGTGRVNGNQMFANASLTYKF